MMRLFPVFVMLLAFLILSCGNAGDDLLGPNRTDQITPNDADGPDQKSPDGESVFTIGDPWDDDEHPGGGGDGDEIGGISPIHDPGPQPDDSGYVPYDPYGGG